MNSLDKYKTEYFSKTFQHEETDKNRVLHFGQILVTYLCLNSQREDAQNHNNSFIPSSIRRTVLEEETHRLQSEV